MLLDLLTLAEQTLCIPVVELDLYDFDFAGALVLEDEVAELLLGFS